MAGVYSKIMLQLYFGVTLPFYYSNNLVASLFYREEPEPVCFDVILAVFRSRLVCQSRATFYARAVTALFAKWQRSLQTLFYPTKLSLRLRGMGYFFTYNSHIRTLFLISGKSHVLAYFMPPALITTRLVGKKARIATFVSYSLVHLYHITHLLLRQIGSEPYRQKGLYYVGQCLRYKKGKKKFV
jgi:hypothetical protein